MSLPLRSRNKGFMLVELIMTLGIGAIIAVSVWAVYSERQVLTRGTETGLAVEQLIFQADASYTSSIEYTQGGNPITMQALSFSMDNELPRGVEREGATYVNRFGGTWSLGTASSISTTLQDILVVTATDIPRSECQVIMSHVAPFVYETYVNGTLVHLHPMTPADGDSRNSVNLEQAMPLCQGASNTMVFHHLKDLKLPDLRRYHPYADDLTDEERGIVPTPCDPPHCVPWRYQETYLDHYNRLHAAWDARESAQSAMD